VTAERCGAPKIQGAETLHCILDSGHDRPGDGQEQGDDETWHQAKVTDYRKMDFGSCRIEVRTEETITWEPLFVMLARQLGGV